MKRTTAIITTAIVALGLAACGSGPAPSPTVPPPSVTPSVQPTSSAATTSSPTPSAVPTASPTPTPLPPLLVLSNSADVKVVNALGVEQWGLTAAAMEQMTGETAQQVLTQGQNVSPQVAGPNILLVDTPSAYGPGGAVTDIVVLSRTGTTLGNWAEPLGSNTEALITSPDGTDWAWNVYSGMSAAGREYGQVDVSGLGKPVRTLFHWEAPLGFTDTAPGWTTLGIIMVRIPSNTRCSAYTGTGTAAFVINPSTGALSGLLTGGEQLLNADARDTVGWLNSDEHAVVINGVTYTESASLVAGAFVYDLEPQLAISPDDDYVAVNRVSQNDTCNGSTPVSSIELVDVPEHSHIDLPNLSILGWWSDNELVALTANQSIWLYTVQGKAVSEISANPNWGSCGVLTG